MFLYLQPLDGGDLSQGQKRHGPKHPHDVTLVTLVTRHSSLVSSSSSTLRSSPAGLLTTTGGGGGAELGRRPSDRGSRAVEVEGEGGLVTIDTGTAEEMEVWMIWRSPKIWRI